jgi:DNA-binding response OmpR family regulator
MEATGAQVSTASNALEAARILEEAEEWPDVLIVEHRILEKESPALMGGLRVDEWQPVIIPTDFQHLSQDPAQVPLRGEETLRRLEALVVRLKGVFEPTAHQFIRVGRLTIDPSRKEVVFAARRVPLPPIQFRLLLYLALNAGRVVDQRELVREIWGYAGVEGEAREMIKKHVRLIRRKLGWIDESTNYLQSVRGFGYVLSPPPRTRNRKTPGESTTEA